jgi:hypothetical protein
MPITISGDGTITGLSAGGLPDATIQQADLAVGVASTGPAFSAYGAGSQTVTSGTYTKIQLSTEEWDTNNNFDNATNYRFTPTVAGYYHFNGQVAGGTNQNRFLMVVYKNGSAWKVGNDLTAGFQCQVSCFGYANGSTDYFELYVYLGTTMGLNPGPSQTWFQGCLVRGA